MGRSIFGLVAGCLVITASVLLWFSGAFLIIGPDRVFQAGTYHVSTLWIGLSFILSFIAAIGGGYVCSRIAGRKVAKTLAVLVLILGLLFAIPVLTRDAKSASPVREPERWPVILNP